MRGGFANRNAAAQLIASIFEYGGLAFLLAVTVQVLAALRVLYVLIRCGNALFFSLDIRKFVFSSEYGRRLLVACVYSETW